jgi:hypothetical protein
MPAAQAARKASGEATDGNLGADEVSAADAGDETAPGDPPVGPELGSTAPARVMLKMKAVLTASATEAAELRFIDAGEA